MASNFYETHLTDIFRPILFSLVFCLVIYLLFRGIFRKDKNKSPLITSITILLFYSYGHVYNIIESNGSLADLIGHHRYLIAIFGLVWISALLFVIFRKTNDNLTLLFNLVGIVLVVLPIFQITWMSIGERRAKLSLGATQSGQIQSDGYLDYSPDVYYIILDTFARPDVLEEEYGIDLSEFVTQMENLGFYYASESQSNYRETFSSLTSSLNMQYVYSIAENLNTTRGSAVYQETIKNNEVVQIFQSLDYQTIAFSTGYRWSEITTADIFYFTDFSMPVQGLSSFESLLLQTTIVYPLRGYFNVSTTLNSLQPHIDAQRRMLSTLPEIPENPNPTFTFAHFLVPHVPFIFDEDGSILEDPGYYSGADNGAINDEYRLDGYRRQVQFISQQILDISKSIIENSDNPPIIIIQGDHGFKGENRNKILNLYYFPDLDYGHLYETISPINSFRVILSQYFGLDYPVIEDKYY